MKVLLTGGSGFLGRYVLQCLRQHGIETVMLGRRPATGNSAVQFIEADLLAMPDFNALVKHAKATHLLHLAWETEHGKFWTSPLNLSWIYATVRLVDAFCHAGGQRVVVAGSCAEYEWSQSICREDETPLSPGTLYGTTKNTTRRLLNAICTQHQVPLAWGRLFLLYGAGENRARLIPSLVDVFRGQLPPFGINASAARDFLHASDVAEGFVTLLRGGDTGVYNICSGQPVLLGNVAREIARLLDADPQVVLRLATDRPDEPASLVGDNSKLKNLGWKPALSLEEGLEQTVLENSVASIEQCPVCESPDLAQVLKRNRVPVHQNLVITRQDAARAVTRGDIDLAACEACGFVFNRVFDLSLLAYGEDYDASQFYSAYYDAHLDGIAQALVEQHGVRNCTIIEVGCGRGQFLRKLVSNPAANNYGVGFDPSYTGPETDLEGRLKFRRSYYDRSCSNVAADVVVCRHVIEHVPEPLTLLRSVRQALENSPHARVFFETPCVEWILKNRVVWDIFYEHCSLFSVASLSLAFQKTGFTVKHVEHIFGGQYLWLEAQLSHAPPPVMLKHPEISELARAYGADEKHLRKTWLEKLVELNSRGKVALWGAGAKGSTFANLVDPGCALIDCVTDVNPNKRGRFIPGTGHPIVALAELPRRGVKYAVLMNANYREENQKLLTETGIELELVDWSK